MNIDEFYFRYKNNLETMYMIICDYNGAQNITFEDFIKISFKNTDCINNERKLH